MKAQQLARAKQQALWCLLIAAALFIATTVLEYVFPYASWSSMNAFFKMVSEAALVGGLADWFAVTALFKPIPARYPIAHTNIVAANKQRIAANLADFVKEKFFNPPAIKALVQQSHPAEHLSQWLQQPANAARSAKFISDAGAGALNMVSDATVQDVLTASAKKLLAKLDMRPFAGGTLRVLTKEGRHQQILDQLIAQAATLLERPASQAFMAEKLHQWLRTEYRRLEKILPTQWISEQGAQVATKAIVSTIADINADPQHPLRQSFDRYIQRLIHQIEHDEDTGRKLSQWQHAMLENQPLHEYMGHILKDVRVFLQQDLAKPDSRARHHIQTMLKDFGQAIAQRPELSRTINTAIENSAAYLGPQVSDFLTRHIKTTIENWDDQEMAEQIELNIGKDLQKVRINGTLVGGLIGGILFGLEWVIDVVVSAS